MLVPEKEADGIFLGHIPAEHFHRRLQVGVRESLDGLLQVCVGGLQRFLQFFRLDDLCSAPATPAAGQTSANARLKRSEYPPRARAVEKPTRASAGQAERRGPSKVRGSVE